MHSILHRFAEQSMSLSTVLLMNLAEKTEGDELREIHN